MLPAEPILLAARRWIALLRTSDVRRATAIVRADAHYTDLTQTQYSAGFEWLKELQLLVRSVDGYALSPSIKLLPQSQTHQLVVEKSLERVRPAWLRDSDVLVIDEGGLPSDAELLASVFGLRESDTLNCIRQVHGRIDLAERAKLGLQGEEAVVKLLEQLWPGSTFHVSKQHDGWGYDVLFRFEEVECQLEVKSTNRLGRLVIHLSRHEFEVARRSDCWLLVVAGLNDKGELAAIATVPKHTLLERAPLDTIAGTKWEGASYELRSTDLIPGISVLSNIRTPSSEQSPLVSLGQPPERGPFSWMP